MIYEITYKDGKEISLNNCVELEFWEDGFLQFINDDRSYLMIAGDLIAEVKKK